MSYLLQQLADIRSQLAELRDGRTTHRITQVTAVDPGTATFTAQLPDEQLPDGQTIAGQTIAGLDAPPQLLPAPGQRVRIRMEGATPIYEPAGISEDAVTGRELAPGAVVQENLAAGLLADLGGAIIHRQLEPGQTEPAAPPEGRSAYWWDASQGNRLRQYNPATGAWDPVQFGNGAIDPNSLVASDVLVDGTVSAELLEAVIVLATTIIAGDPAGYHAMLSPSGFRSYAPNPAGGVYEATRLGTGGEDRLGIADAAGNTLAAIDQAGVAAVQGLSSVAEPTFAGSTLTEWLTPYAQLVSRWGDGNAPSARSTGPELGYGEVLVTLRQGRRYALRTSHMRMNGSVDGQLGCVYVRYTTSAGLSIPATPSTSSPLLTRAFVPVPYGVAAPVAPISRLFDTPAGTGLQSYRFLLSHNLIQGSGDVFLDQTTADPIQMWFEDQGPAAVQNLTYNNGGGSTVIAPSPMRQTLEYASAWSRTFRGDGSFWSDNGDAYQGYGDSFNGNQASMIGWNDWTGTLAGATVEKVEVYLYAHWWWEGDGGTAVIGVHGHTGPPGGLTLTQADIMRVSGWKRGEPRWVTLPAAFNDGFRTGNYRGILLGPAPSNAGEYYAKFAGGTNVLMRITFVK